MAYKYIYQFTDHLGNVRLSYSDADKDGKVDVARTGGRSGNVDVDGDGDYGHEIIEENNFYPFGLKHKGYNNTIAGRDHSFEYNGKEMETSLGYNMMEMDMRQYDPAIARWVVQDPVTHHNYSPYNAFDNNPVFYADPSGADAIWSPNNTVQNNHKPNEHPNSVPHSGEFHGGGGIAAINAAMNMDVLGGLYAAEADHILSGFVKDFVNGKFYNGGNNNSWQKHFENQKIDPDETIKFDLNSTFFLQYEGRASLILTGSLAIGVAIDTKGNLGVYSTISFGGGIALGANTGWTLGFSSVNELSGLKGWGGSVGAYATANAAVGVQGAAELNFAIDVEDHREDKSKPESAIETFKRFSPGVSVGIPVQAGTFGGGVGVYGEGSYTKLLYQGNVTDVVNYLAKTLRNKDLIDLTIKEKERLCDKIKEIQSIYLER